MSWKDTTLGEIVSVKHGWAFKSQHFESEGPFFLVTPGNFNEEGGLKLRPEKDRSYSGEFAPEYLLDQNDLIIAMTEQAPGLLGSSAIIPEPNRFLHNQRIGLVKLKDASRTSCKYLYYLFNTSPVRGQIYGSATGTKVRHTAPERIYRVSVSMPDLPTQKRIAAILSAYDDLIENNRRRIALLEQAARLLYREWFVHFRFPGHETAKFVDGLPEGWKSKTLGDVCSTNKNAYKKGKLPDRINYIDIGAVSTGQIDSTTRYAAEDAPGRARRVAEPLDTIWSNVRPNLKAYSLVLEPTENDVFSTGFTVLHADAVSPFFLYFTVTTDDFIKYLMNHATGVSYPAVRADDFERATILVPTENLMDVFHQFTEPKFKQIKKLSDASAQLTRARDLLLPRLMDGRIPV